MSVKLSLQVGQKGRKRFTFGIAIDSHRNMKGAFARDSIVILAVAISVVSWAQSRAVPMTTFSDPVNGVSFRYPSVWARETRMPSYIGPAIMQQGENPRLPKAIVVFRPAGTYYASTNLAELNFVYDSFPASAPAACEGAFNGNLEEAFRRDGVRINGVPFTSVEGGGAGTCNRAEQKIYWTYRVGTCYLFEADLNQFCASPPDRRELTKMEIQALNRHLNDIMQSIRIKGK